VSVQNKEQPKLSYSYKGENLKLGRHEIYQFFEAGYRLMGWQDSGMATTVDSTRETPGCHPSEAATFGLQGTLYGSAIERALSYEESELAARFEEFQNINPMDWMNGIDRRARKADEQRLRRFNQVFVPFWRQMKAADSDAKRMNLLRDLLKVYGSDLTGFEFFTVLAMKDQYPEGVTLKVTLDGKRCHLAWSRSGELDQSLDDVMKDW
jgi:hypothetical protein